MLADDDVSVNPLVLAEATRALAVAMLATFPNSGSAALDERSRQGWADPAVLRRAVAYIDEHAGEDIGVDDVAAAARIGVRGLQYVFRRYRGCTPMEQLRRVRMVRAHAGRFSVEYKRLYSRSPSQTLRG